MEGITGIIAEYNPFHKGHGYQIEKVRKLTRRPVCPCDHER